MSNLSRLICPGTIALFGSIWAANVIEQLKHAGYAGEIWPVHPKRPEIAGVKCFASIADLPSAPDASFIGVNREATIDIVGQLSKIGAGGAICFASGFLESEAESEGGANLQQKLIEAAGDFSVLGPNCYGLINYLDNIPLWPDQHGGVQVENGVAIIAQSSNIAINLTMQRRGLPIGFVVTVGNQAQSGISEIAIELLQDDRITALGFYIEGFDDLRAFEAMTQLAHKMGKPMVAIKSGKSEKAAQTARTHTASLAGSSVASSAFLKRLGIIEVDTPEVFLETLKLLHFYGLPESKEVVSVSCSGGEASLVSDLSNDSELNFRSFSDQASQCLKLELGPIVTIANPLDYHTFIWGDVERMTNVFAAVMADGFSYCLFVLDIPREDRCDPESFQCAKEAIVAAQKATGVKVVVASLLQENTSEETAIWFAKHGICTTSGLATALDAMEATATNQEYRSPHKAALIRCNPSQTILLNEAVAKQKLASKGLVIPNQIEGNSVEETIEKVADNLAFPLVLKGQGFLHKSDVGAVVLNLNSKTELVRALQNMDAPQGYLVEEMIGEVIVELLVGVSQDETGLMLLTIGAGGVLTELLKDTQSLTLPATRNDIRDAVLSLRSFQLLSGYRGKDAADIEKLCEAIQLLADYACETENLVELEINPLMVRKTDCVIADAVITLSK